jgi:hypothetical protein
MTLYVSNELTEVILSHEATKLAMAIFAHTRMHIPCKFQMCTAHTRHRL